MTKEGIKETINNKSGVMLYFSGQDCGVCEALKPKIKEAMEHNFPLIEQIYIDAALNQEISAEFNVFAVPTVLVFLEGKEFIRKSRNLSIASFIQELKRPYQIMVS